MRTMSGRRVRNAVQEVLDGCSQQENEVVIAGLGNTYASYVTTFEEYQVERNEGASTIYGPHTLSAYLQQYQKLAHALCDQKTLPPGPAPPNMLSKQVTLQPGVVYDTARIGLVHDVDAKYAPGQSVQAMFVSGHPRNNLMLEKTFMSVERKDTSSGNWTKVATDADWETRFYWSRTNFLLGQSEATVGGTSPWTRSPVVTVCGTSATLETSCRGCPLTRGRPPSL